MFIATMVKFVGWTSPPSPNEIIKIVIEYDIIKKLKREKHSHKLYLITGKIWELSYHLNNIYICRRHLQSQTVNVNFPEFEV